MRNRRRLLSSDEGTNEIWPSFTDVMSTMSLILFVLVLLSYVRSLVAAKRLDALQHQIVASQLQLRDLEAQLGAGRAELDDSKRKLLAQQAIISDSSRQLDTVRAQLSGIAVLRVGVLTKLKQAIESELGSKTTTGADLVSIGNNGNVVINESLVFEYGSFAVKAGAKPLLDSLARALGRMLGDAEVRANIDTILIQGHTDERGSAPFNWDLSAKRATAVLNYLFEANKTLADSYGSYFAASAYSMFRPLDASKTEGAYQKNRRIEISVVPKDDHVRKVIDDYVQSVAPSPVVPAPAPLPAAP